MIDINLREKQPSRGLRVVRASIDGKEINEQIILRGSSATSARFVGWLEDPTGAKRVQFTFPPSGDMIVQVGVFEATELSKEGGSGKVDQVPPTAAGASFAGPLVGDGKFAVGEPVAAGIVRLRAA